MNLDISDKIGKIVAYFIIGIIGAIILMGVIDFFYVIIYAKHLTINGFRIAGLFGFFIGIIFSYILDNF